MFSLGLSMGFSSTMKDKKLKGHGRPTLGRMEPFPSWEWYGLGLFADLPEEEREPFKQWLIEQNKRLPESERWPFVQLKIPDGYERHEDIFALKDHFHWALKMAFAKTAAHGEIGLSDR